MRATATHEEVARQHPRVIDAVGRVFDAAESVAAGHVDLAKLEAEMTLERMAYGGAVLAAGAICLLVAWVIVLVLCYPPLVRAVGPAAALGVLAAGNALVGAGLLAAGRRMVMPRGRS